MAGFGSFDKTRQLNAQVSGTLSSVLHAQPESAFFLLAAIVYISRRDSTHLLGRPA